jgi:predicted hydrocarbon binding protein
MISPFFKKLLFSRMVNVENGEFKIFNKNFFLGPVKAFVDLREELKSKSSIDMLYKFGENISKDIFDYSKKTGTEKDDCMKFWLNMINLSGFGDMEIIEISNDKCYVIVNCKNSPIAEEYSKSGKTEMVDEILAGIIGDFFSQWFGKPVMCEEIACIAKGNKYCQFKISLKK